MTAEKASTIAQPDKTKGNDPYEESKPIATTEPTNDNTSGTGNPLTVTQTFYHISINKDNYGDAGSVLSNSTAFWVASRFVNTDEAYAYFGLRSAYVMTDGAGATHTYMDGDCLFRSYVNPGTGSNRLRPIVSLSSSILSETKDANGAWNLK